MATNVNGTVATFEPFIADMKRRGGGTLVGIASVAGVRGLPGAGAYSASKAAVRCYCESLRVELRQAGIRVVTIAPGFIQTPMTARNPYKMPFLMPVDRFAAAAGRAIDRASSYTVIPWQMGIVARLLRIVPNALYDRVAAGRKRKPRREPG
jgi:short-subunit dehydrogenase